SLKLRAAWSSSPVVELEGCRLNQISGLSLLATVPASAVVLSVASELAAASEVPPEAAVLSEEVVPPQAARLSAMAAARVNASAFLIVYSPLVLRMRGFPGRPRLTLLCYRKIGAKTR